ncbi:Uncharacterised protein [Vibrio cholerae]|nr:Uncharacterised protein [Vibrio cholerae]
MMLILQREFMSDKFMCIIAILLLQWAMILLFLNWNGIPYLEDLCKFQIHRISMS